MSILNYLHQNMGSSIQSSHAKTQAIEQDYLHSVVKQNYTVIAVATMLCIIIEIYNLTYIFTRGAGLTTQNNRIYFGFYLLLLIIPTCITLTQRILRSRPVALYRIHLLAAIFYLSWNLLFNSYQIYRGHQNTAIVFLTALITVAVLLRLKLHHSLGLTLGSFGLFMVLNLHRLDIGDVTNVIISTAVTIMATVLLFHQEIDALYNRKQIETINEALTNEKEHLRISLEKHHILMEETNLLSFDFDIPSDTMVLSNRCAQQLQWPVTISSPMEWLSRSNTIHPDDIAPMLEMIERSINEGIQEKIDIRIKDIAAAYIWYDFRCFVQCNDNGEATTGVGALWNIDDAKRMEEHMNQRLQSQMEGANDYFQHLKSTQEKILLYHHDMRHSLKLMEQLAAQGDTDALHAHTLLAQNELQAITPNLYCGNDTVNLICGSFDQLAQKDQVTFHCHVTLPSQLPFTNLELCTLFFNLLENALFAARETQGDDLRQIRIDAYINHQKLVITVKNGYVGTIAIQEGLPVTQSQDDEHGLGVKSIVDVVTRHNGMYIFKTEGQIFVSNLLLSL